jgi:vanillate O-demethylase monooxygenase subunit
MSLIQQNVKVPHTPRPSPNSYLPEDWDILARHWYPVARCVDIGDKPVAATLLDVDLVLYRMAGGFRVARDQCPHRGVPLSMGWVENEQLICPYHGLHFAADGRCTKIPAQPNVAPPEKFRLAQFPAIERYGLLWTCLMPDEGAEPAIPAFPNWDAAGYQPILPPPVDIDAAPGRQIEGFVDVAHFAWVHHEAFADRTRPEVPAYTTEAIPAGIRMEYWSTVSNYPKALQHLEPEGFRWLRVFEIYPPFAASLTVHFPGDDRLNILNLASPVSARKTRLFVPITRNFDVTGSLEDVYAFNAQIFAEDQALVERQMPKDLPLDNSEEIHFAADRMGMGYRRLLKGMGLALTSVAC